MKKQLLSCCLAALGLTAIQAQSFNEWKDPEVNSVNRSAMHTNYFAYASADEAKAGIKENSTNFMTLNGPWKFNWVRHADARPTDFYQTNFNDKGWDDLQVPGVWELNGYGDPIYVNVGYAWRSQFKNNPPQVPTENNHVGSYRKEIILPADWKGKEIFAHFGSVTSNMYLWVNESRSSLRAGSILSVVNTPPFMQKRNPYDPNEYDEQAYGARILNPLAANAADSNTNTDHINGSLGFTVDILKGLKFKTTFGIELTNEHWDYYLDPISTSDGRGTKGRVEESFSRNFEWLFENLLTYDCSFNKHNLSILGGATQQRAQYNGSWMAGFDLAESYPDIHSISAANQLDKDACGSSASAWTLASFLGRVAYNYDSRYLLTVNFRADGSSRFALGHRWGTFPSVSAGWRISGEKFMQPLQDIVTDLKLRAGWGMNGNQGGFGNYAYMASMSVSKLPVSEGNLYPGLAIKPGSAANKELTWEKTSQWNLGLDLTMFDSRLSFSVDAYYKKTTDLLLTVSLPENVVPSSVTRNDGEMVNKGMEFTLSSQNFKGNFQWNTDFNISFNRNKLTKLGLNKVYYYAEMYESKEKAVILKEGLPLGTFFGYISEGVDPETGDIIYRDLNGNGFIDPEDRTTLGNAQPKFIYGMTNTFSYAGFDLSVFLQGSQGNKIFNASRIDMEGMTDFRNQSVRVLDRWKRPGMITNVPRVGNTENNHNSSRFVEDGSYLRLKTVTLSYNFPKKWLNKIHLSRLQAYVTGQNLFTLTKYKGYDPEVNAFGGDSVAQGVDYGTYPQSRAVIFGLNVEF